MSKRTNKLPRGLWIGKVRKPEKMWADPAVPEYFDNYYFRVRKVGRPMMLRSAETTNKEEATARGKLAFEATISEKWESLRVALNATRIQRMWCTIGEWETAFEKVAKARGIDHVRPINCLRLILATVKGWKGAYDKTRMDGNGGELIRKVQALSSDEVNETTRMEFWRICQGEKERPNLDTKAPPEMNGTINSTIQNARVMCSKLNRQFELAELAIPWDIVQGFVSGSLPVASKDWGSDLPSFEAYKLMLESADKMAASPNPEDQELALVNELFRSDGLRSIEVVNARESWLEDGKDGRVYIVLKHRPKEGWSCKTGTQGRLPLSDDLARRLRARCAAAREAGVKNPFLIYPKIAGPECIPDKWEDPVRRALVRDRHNTWLKKFIGEVKSGQGNHRLRKYLATMLYEEHGLSVALKYLRHAKEAVAFQSYIQQREEKLPIVRREDLAAWGAIKAAA